METSTTSRFSHRGLLYRDEAEFAAVVGGFLADASAGGAATLAIVPGPHIELLDATLGPGHRVEFLDAHTVGKNPARLMTEWARFVDRHPHAPIAGVGQPYWRGRSRAECEEVLLSELLVGLALDHQRHLDFLCPYDVANPDGVEIAHATHPELHDTTERTNTWSDPIARADSIFRQDLPPPPTDHWYLPFDTDLFYIRELVTKITEAAGLALLADDAVFCVNELATNALVHGGGEGSIRIWLIPNGIAFEIEDSGRIDDPLVGRLPPVRPASGGRGVWMVNQICDLVQIRSNDSGTKVRFRLLKRR